MEKEGFFSRLFGKLKKKSKKKLNSMKCVYAGPPMMDGVYAGPKMDQPDIPEDVNIHIALVYAGPRPGDADAVPVSSENEDLV